MSTKEIKVKYAAFITSLSILKGTIDTKFNIDTKFKLILNSHSLKTPTHLVKLYHFI